MKAPNRNLFILVAIAVIAGVIAVVSLNHGKKPSQKRVLVVMPLTGATSSWGEHFKRGVDAFLLKAPENIEVQVVDSQSNPAATLSAVQQACLQGKPYAIVSSMSSTTVPLSAWTKQQGIFLVGCIISDKILENPVNVQRVYPSVYSNADPLADYATKKFKRVAIIYSNEDLGLAVKNEFTKRYKGGEIVLTDGYALKDADVRTLVAKFVAAKPDAIVVTGVGTSFWAVIRELRAQDYQGQILSDASFADQVQIAALGPAADGIIFVGSETELSEPRTEAAKNFNQVFLQKFGVPVNYTAVTFYESLRILDHLSKNNPLLEVSAFQQLGSWEGVPGTIRFTPNGDCEYPWFLLKREAGTTVALPK